MQLLGRNIKRTSDKPNRRLSVYSAFRPEIVQVLAVCLCVFVNLFASFIHFAQTESHQLGDCIKT